MLPAESLPARSLLKIPQQIADEIGVAIIDGDLTDGTRLLEEEIAARYRVSRSPVREAIALLERRGLVRTVPRRGAYVVGHTLAMVADLFNTRAVLVGLAGRYIARRRDPTVIKQFAEQLNVLDDLADRPDISPLEFSNAVPPATAVLYRNCGADHLARMLADHAHESSWAMIWRKRPLDFLTAARRRKYVDDFRLVTKLIEAGADREVEHRLRRMMFESRDYVLASLVTLKGGVVDPLHCLDDEDHPPR